MSLYTLIPISKKCDYVVDCPYGDDEDITMCISDFGWKLEDLSLSVFTSYKNDEMTETLYATGSMTTPVSITTIDDVVEAKLARDTGEVSFAQYSCYQSAFSIPATWLCDGMTDCPNGDDEAIDNCLLSTSNQPIQNSETITLLSEQPENVNLLCDESGYKIHISPGQTAIFSYDSYPKLYSANQKCRWKFSSDSQVKLQILKFLLPGQRGCNSDRLSIYDGGNIGSPLLGHYCQLPNYIPLSFTSTGNSLFVDFFSDADNHGTFALLVRSIDFTITSTDCLTVTSEYIGTHSEPACSSWSLESIGLYSDQKLKPDFVPGDFSRLLGRRINQIWESESHDYCRAIENTVDNINDVDETLKCQTIDNNQVGMQDCTLSKCQPSCPSGFVACITGECIPETNLCNRKPECRLRDDELLPCRMYRLNTFQKIDYTRNNNQVQWYETIDGVGSQLVTFNFENSKLELASLTIQGRNGLGSLVDIHTGTMFPLSASLPEVYSELHFTASNQDLASLDSSLDSIQFITTDCSHDITYENGLIFTNEGLGVPQDYADDTICIYRISDIDVGIEMYINYDIEKQKSFRGHEEESCYDFLSLSIDDEMYRDFEFGHQLCGTGLIKIDISAGSSVELLLVSDAGGKYTEKSNLERYGSNVLRTPLSCCASDCDSNVKCNCPPDQGRFEIELRAKTVQRRRNVLLVPSNEWSEWYSESTPSGVQVAGLFLSGGEYEQTDVLRQSYPTLCTKDTMIAAQCKSLSTNRTQANFEQSIAKCDETGLTCYNRAQAGVQCDDYAIRYYCALDITDTYQQNPSCVQGWTASTRLFANQASLAQIIDTMESNGIKVCSAEYVVGIRCKNIMGEKLDQIDQNGFNPGLECSVDYGYK